VYWVISEKVLELQAVTVVVVMPEPLTVTLQQLEFWFTVRLYLVVAGAT